VDWPGNSTLKGLLKTVAVLAVLFTIAVLLFHEKRGEAGDGHENRLEIYYMYNEGEPQAAWLEDAVERFKGLHPGLEVDLIFAGREVLGKIRPRIIIENPPDLVNQGGDILRVLMQDGVLEPWNEALEGPAFDRDMPWEKAFIPGLLDLYTFDGKTYMIPVGLFCSVFFYDRNQFERFDLEPPKTWREFLAVCEVFKENGIEPIAADGTEPGYNVMWTAALITRTTTVRHFADTARGGPGTSWTEDAYVDAAGLVRQLRDRGYVMKGYQGSKWPSAQMRWAQGECALLYNGTWIPKEMAEKLPEGFRMGMFRFPIVEGYPGSDGMTQEIGAECYAIPTGARNKKMAVAFVKYITRLEECRNYVDMDIAPAILGAGMPESLEGLDELLAPPYRLTKGLAGIMPNWYRAVARDYWSDFFLGHYTPEEVCRLMEAEQKRYYERLEALGRKPEEPAL